MGSKDIFNGFTQEVQYLQYIVNNKKNEICQKGLMVRM